MKLLIDHGNSCLKWALVDDAGAISRRGRARDVPGLCDSPEGPIQGGAPELVAISCVAGAQALDALVARLADAWSSGIFVLHSPAASAGLRSGYHDPARLGVDRWLAMLGARSLSSGPVVVVDAGTALTVDAVDARGMHLGGYIVPGFELQCRALNTATASVGMADRGVTGGWGRDTSAAVRNGIVLQLASFIERAVVELESAVADTCSLILTGGDAGLLAPALRTPSRVDEVLIFKGMCVQLEHPEGYTQVK